MRVGDCSSYRQARNDGPVEPSLDGTVGADMVLKAVERTSGIRDRSGNALTPGQQRSNLEPWIVTLRGKVWQNCVVRLAVICHDFGLTANAQVFTGTQAGIGHDDVRNVICGEGLGEFPASGY